MTYTTSAIRDAEAAALAAVEADARTAEETARALEEGVRNGDADVTMAAIREAEDAKTMAGLRLEAVRREYAGQRATAAAARAQEVRDEAVEVLGTHNANLVAAQRKVRKGVAEMAAAVAAGNADIDRVLGDLSAVEAEAAALGVQRINSYGKPPALRVGGLQGAAHDVGLAVYMTVFDGLSRPLQEYLVANSDTTLSSPFDRARDVLAGRQRVGWGTPALPPTAAVEAAGYYDAQYGVWRDGAGRELGADGQPVAP